MLQVFIRELCAFASVMAFVASLAIWLQIAAH